MNTQTQTQKTNYFSPELFASKSNRVKRYGNVKHFESVKIFLPSVHKNVTRIGIANAFNNSLIGCVTNIETNKSNQMFITLDIYPSIPAKAFITSLTEKQYVKFVYNEPYFIIVYPFIERENRINKNTHNYHTTTTTTISQLPKLDYNYNTPVKMNNPFETPKAPIKDKHNNNNLYRQLTYVPFPNLDFEQYLSNTNNKNLSLSVPHEFDDIIYNYNNNSGEQSPRDSGESTPEWYNVPVTPIVVKKNNGVSNDGIWWLPMEMSDVVC